MKSILWSGEWILLHICILISPGTMILQIAQGDVALLRHQLDMKKMMRDALRDKRDKLTQVEHQVLQAFVF